jgi:hypothetical protein
MVAFEYKPSPFYEIVARIGDVRVCDGAYLRLRVALLQIY